MRPDEESVVYGGRLFDVAVERWGEHEREIVRHPGSVAIVAVDADDRLVLFRQRREAARAELVELPAGTRESGESALDCARRELGEETGLTGGRWRELARFWTSPGFLHEELRLFLAEQTVERQTRTEPDENVELARWPVAELPSRLGEIHDAKMLVGVLLLLRERGA
jgi:ADP-ribose pyrophosphatase